MAAKTRITGIIDQSSFGLTSSTEIEIDNKALKSLLNTVRGQVDEHKWLRASGEDTFYLNDLNGSNYAVYQVKRSGSRIFLNVTGNPTRMLSGKNDFPVLLTGIEGNAALETFKFGLRVPYLILESIPSSKPFSWSRDHRKLIDAGNFSVNQLQLAWYSADLGSSRDTALKYLRRLYAGQVGNTTETVSSLINVTSTAFDNGKENYNLALRCRKGKNNMFSLVLYAKDKLNESDKCEVTEDSDRVKSRIRFDCTLYGTYLKDIKCSKVNDLERLFQLKCEEDSYDIGFYKWLTDKIYNRLRLGVFLRLDADKFCESIEEIKTYINTKTNAKSKMLCAWLNREEFSTVETWAKMASVSVGSISENKGYLESTYGLDFFIPYRMYLHALSNLVTSCMTDDEYYLMLDRRSNDYIDFDKLRNKSKLVSEEVNEKLTLGKGFRLAKMKPTRVRVDNYHLLKLINSSSRPKQETAKKHKFEM